MRSVVLLEPDAQPAVVAIDLVAQHPGDRHPGREGTLDHALRQLRLGGERDGLRHGGRGAALPVVGPLLGQIQFTVDQGMALATGIGQENTDLTVLDPSRSPRILARHAGRLGSLLQEPGFVDDQHAVRRPQVLDHITAAQVARLVLVPQDMRQNPLGAPGAAVPDRFGQLPAVLALGRAEQPLQIQAHLAPRLRTPEQLTQAPLQLRQRLTPPGQPCRLQHQTHPEPKPQISTVKLSDERWRRRSRIGS